MHLQIIGFAEKKVDLFAKDYLIRRDFKSIYFEMFTDSNKNIIFQYLMNISEVIEGHIRSSFYLFVYNPMNLV